MTDYQQSFNSCYLGIVETKMTDYEQSFESYFASGFSQSAIPEMAVVFGMCALAFFCFTVRRCRQDTKGTRRPPKPVIVPGGYFLLGNIDHVFPLKDFPRKLLALSKTHGSLFQMSFLGRRFLVCSDTPMAREALMKRPVTFGRPRFFSTQRPFEDTNVFEKKVPAMFGAEGEDWARVRRVAAPAFSKLNVSLMVTAIGEQVDVMLDRMSECANANETFQMDQEAFKFANRVISAVVYGSLTGEVASYFFSDDMQNDLNARFKFLQERTFLAVPRWALAVFDYFNGRPEGMVAYDRFHKYSLMAFAQVKHRPVDDRPTLLNNLLRSDVLSNAEVEQNVESFFTAGGDTTASMIAWVVYFLVTSQKRTQAKPSNVNLTLPYPQPYLSVL